ncbi:MAG: hypothetical protein ACXWTP_08825 [Methylosarcina sp.]
MQDFLFKLADSDGFHSLNSLSILLKIRCIAFETYANNLVTGDNNEVTDVFVAALDLTSFDNFFS